MRFLVIGIVFSCYFGIYDKSRFDADTTEHYLQTRFDYAYTMMLGYGLVFLLPCLIGIIAAVLFFMERDCDTFKNIRTIPVTNTQLILAKISLLFILWYFFCINQHTCSCCFAKSFKWEWFTGWVTS